MAGIGFKLRELVRQDNLMGTIGAYAYGMLIVGGPWLLTILAISLIILFGDKLTAVDDLINFRVILIYNFSFSLVLSSPVVIILTRFLADSIFERDVSLAIGLLVGSLMLVFLSTLPLVGWFYFYYVNLPISFRILAFFNFMLLASIWVIMTYVSAIKNFKVVVMSFFLGIFCSLFFAIIGSIYGTPGILFGFSIGSAVIVAFLLLSLFLDFPYPIKQPFAFLHYFKEYWMLAVSGFLFNLGSFVDKWMMWFSEYGMKLDSNFYIYHDYDSASFMAYLTMLPVLSIFTVIVETSFFEGYQKLFANIRYNANLDEIYDNYSDLIDVFRVNARNVVILQLALALIVVLLSPRIYDSFGINYLQLGMFRFCVLGVAMQTFVLFLNIMFYYFSAYKVVMYTNIIFVVTNIIFTSICIHLGFNYYGIGYFISTLITFIFSSISFFYYFAKLPYNVFVTRNRSTLLI